MNGNDLNQKEIISIDSFEFDQTILNLQHYNDSIINSTASINMDPNIKKALDIAGNDVWGGFKGARAGWEIGMWFGPNGGPIGAAIGGAFVAGYYSYKTGMSYKTRGLDDISLDDCIGAAIKMQETITDFLPYYPTKVHLGISQNKKDLILYGVKHNLILDNLINKRYGVTPPEEIFSSTECYVLTHSEFKNMFYEENIESLEIFLRRKALNKSERVMQLYLEAIITANSYKNIESISNQYISEVCSDNNLGDSDIDNIIGAICIMACTSEYWKVFG